MTDLDKYFDEYSRKARLYPALLVAMPLAVTLTLLWPGLSLEKLMPIIVAAGLPFFTGNIVRDRGKLLEERLVRKWAGMPTTRMLRLSDTSNNPDQTRRRRLQLEALTGVPLPTCSEELNRPRRSDERYTSATRMLIARVRRHKDRHPLLQTENICYGYRRNLLALKPFAITLLILLLAVDALAFHLGRDPQIVGLNAAIHILLLLTWITTVRNSWVRRQATTYAERLFDALEDPALTQPEKTVDSG
jgi:hypothetical protein